MAPKCAKVRRVLNPLHAPRKPQKKVRPLGIGPKLKSWERVAKVYNQRAAHGTVSALYQSR